jgi:hypothetical protein
MEVYLHVFLTSAQCPESFTLGKEPLILIGHLDRRLGVPQSRSGRCEEGKVFFPCQESNHYSSAVQPVARHCTDLAIPAPRS